MSIKISGLIAALDANLTSVTKVPVTDATGTTVRASMAQVAKASRVASAVYNVLDYAGLGVVLNNGTTDATSVIQAADTAANAAGARLHFPAGVYKVSSTVTKNADWYGDGRLRTEILTTITDGTPTILIPNVDLWSMKDMRVRGDIASPKNTTGIYTTPTVTGDGASRYTVRDVEVTGCAAGWYVHGWVPDARNVWATYCTFGFTGKEMNGGVLDLRIEGCGEGYLFDTCDGLTLELLCEGNSTRGGRLKKCRGVGLTAPYFETNVGGHLLIGVPEGAESGSDVQCTSIVINGGTFVGTNSHQYAITADYVDGLDVNLPYLTGSSDNTNVLVKSNARNIRYNGVPPFGWVADDSLSMSPAFNYCPNPTFKYWLRGFKAVVATRSTVSQETTTFRTDGSALKVLATAGQTFNLGQLQLPNEIRDALKGKTVRLGAWVYVPNIAAYAQTNPATQTAYPAIAISDGTTTTASSGSFQLPGHWQFMHVSATLSGAATALNINLYANNSGTAAGGTEYILVDSVVIADETVSIDQLRAGSWVPHPLAGTGFGVNFFGYGTAAPTDTAQTYAIGDRWFNTAPGTAGPSYWECTTAGAGGTAVFTARPTTGAPTAKALTVTTVHTADTSFNLQVGTTETACRINATLTANRTMNLFAGGATAGDEIVVTRQDTSAFTWTIIDFASSATLKVFPISTKSWGRFIFDGTNWYEAEFGAL